MSVFTDAERKYLAGQPLGRLGTLGPDGAPQVRPVGYRYNADLDTMDVGGLNMAASRKYRNVQADPRVSFVVDDLASTDPWRPRGIEIRGRAEALLAGGATGEGLSAEIIRIHPRRGSGLGSGHRPICHAPCAYRRSDPPLRDLR
jgi:pyridoxamine 5'-phosphate oxidase family protein